MRNLNNIFAIMLVISGITSCTKKSEETQNQVYPTPEKQLIISDFDGNGSNGSTKLSWSGFNSIMAYGANIVDTAISSSKIGTPSPQSGNSMYVKSKVPNGAYYSCGFMTSTKDLGGMLLATFTDNYGVDYDTLVRTNKPLTIKNSFGNNTKYQDVYLNFSYYNKGNNQTTIVPFFKIWQKVNNPKLTYQESFQGYVTKVTASTTNQWKNVSINLSEFLNENREYIYDLNMISTFGIDLGTDITGPQDIEVAIDNIVLTKGAPLYH